MRGSSSYNAGDAGGSYGDYGQHGMGRKHGNGPIVVTSGKKKSTSTTPRQAKKKYASKLGSKMASFFKTKKK